MGYPVNHGTVLELLAKSRNTGEELSDREKQFIQLLNERIVSYSLFATIIHDPKAHKSFNKAITERFQEFSLPNPTNLLFFTLEDPPQSFVEFHKKEISKKISTKLSKILKIKTNRTYPDLFKLLSGETAISLRNADSFVNQFDFLYFSAGIPVDEKPVVILSKDIFSTEFFWFETDETILPDQLSRLSDLAKLLLEKTDINDSVIKNLLVSKGFDQKLIFKSSSVFSLVEELEILYMLPSNQLDQVSSIYEARLEEYLPRLRQYLNRFKPDLLGLDQVDDEMRVELERVADVLSYLIKFIPSPKIPSNEVCYSIDLSSSIGYLMAPTKTIADLYNKLMKPFLRNISQKIDDYVNAQNETSKANENYYQKLKEVLDPDSFKYLRTSFLLYNAITSGRFGNKEETDISLVAVGIGKTIENEINLSIMHYLRRKVGIELPEFFNRYRYGKIGEFYHDGPPEFSMNLNKQKKRHVIKNFDWLGPSLGTSYIAATIITDEPSLAEIHDLFPNGKFDKLIEIIQVLPSVRNAGGHPYTSITNKDIENMFKMVWDLLETGIFHDMKLLRTRLSKEASESPNIKENY